MAVAVFHEGGYDFVEDTRKWEIKFKEDKQHNLLFHYVEKDILRITELLEGFISKRMDSILLRTEPIESLTESKELMEMFESLHPYYRNNANVFVAAFKDCLNNVLLRANTVKPLSKERYKRLFNGFMKLFGLTGYMECKPVDEYSDFEKECWEVSYDDYILRADRDYLVEAIDPFKKEIKNQKIIKRMLFWIFDVSAPILRELTIVKRVWLYDRFFQDDYEQFKGTKITKNLSSSTIYVQTAAYSDIDYLCNKLGNYLKDFHKNPEDIPTAALNDLYSLAQYAKMQTDSAIYDGYEIDDLHHLLFYEILTMVELNVAIKKCKNCGVYFTLNNLNAEYCNRIPQGEKKTCQVLGARRKYKEKLKDDYPQETYNRFYNKYSQRVRTGVMEKADFETWKNFAKEGLGKVRAGELDIKTFEGRLEIEPKKINICNE